MPVPSLQGRLLALVSAGLLAIWAVVGIVTWVDTRHELDELLDGHLAQAAALLVVQQFPEVDDEERRVEAPLLHRYAPKVVFQVFHEGALAMHSANAPTQVLRPPGDAFVPGFSTVVIDGRAWRVFATEGAERDIEVYVGEEIESRAHILWAVLGGTLWPLAVALPLLALAAWWAVRQGMAPVRRLGAAIATREPSSLEPVVAPGAPAEVQPMVLALNRLFERVGRMVEAERRFTADAAHELRTPIAAIRTQAQVALGEADDGERARALRATLEGCDRAARLVDQLLTLSRLEAAAGHGHAAAGGVPADLAAVARRVVADLAPAAVGRRQDVALESLDGTAPTTVPVAADETLLTVLVRNLVDNALRYAPDGAAVRVRVGTDGAAARLVVEDGGPGLPDAERARLGERFFRAVGQAQPGSGLGWSIVRRIAAVHGAVVETAPSAALGGLAVTVRWPGVPAPR